MVNLDKLKTTYIDPVLASTGYNFKIYTNAGEYTPETRNKNIIDGYFNGLASITNSSTQYLSNGLRAYSLSVMLSIIIPLEMDSDTNNSFYISGNYKTGTTASDKTKSTLNDLYSSLQTAFDKADIQVDVDGTIGAVSYNLPIPSVMGIRQEVGHSIEYRCQISFAFIDNCLNSKSFTMYIDGVEIPVYNFTNARASNLNSDIFADGNGQATNYAESSTLTIQFKCPALTDDDHSAFTNALLSYIYGGSDMNKSFQVKITSTINGTETEQYNKPMIISSCRFSGESANAISLDVVMAEYSVLTINL